VVKQVSQDGLMDEINIIQLPYTLLCLRYWEKLYQTCWCYLLINATLLAKFGFRKSKSTKAALALNTDSVTENMNNNQ
jgi:hypothetical protein